MSDAAIQNAQTRRGALAGRINSLQQQLEAVRRELKVVDDFIAHWHSFAILDEDDPIIPADSSGDKSETERRRPVNPPREVVGDAVEATLREWKRPASRADLFAELADHDITINGTNPEMVFSTMMWRMKDRFERIPKRGYWIKGEPIPGDPQPVADDLKDLLG